MAKYLLDSNVNTAYSQIDKRQAAVKFFDEFMEGIKPKGEFANMTEDEIMAESIAIIKEVRAERKKV
jgi:hypothetical protein